MPGIILAQAGSVPAPTVPVEFTGLQAMTWTSWDGQVFDLLEPAGGTVLAGAVRGLGMPPADRFASQASSVPGSRWDAHRVTERECFWPLFVYRDGGSVAWVEHDRALWRSLRYDRTGVWALTLPDGSVRSLTCRFTGDGDHSFPLDPSLTGWALYGVTLVAEWPYWQGEPVTASWAAEAPVDFYGPGGFGPPFYLGSGHTLGNALVTNPGDVESWPTWTLTGPFNSASIGVGDLAVEVPFAVAAGVTLTIDTDPWGPVASLSTGQDVTGDVSELGFAAIPPGQVPLSLTLDGTGSVEVSFAPNWLRAW